LKKVVVLGAVFGALTIGGTAWASDPIIVGPTGGEGCVSGTPNDTCTYTSTRDGGYVANGTTWTLTVEIAANGDPRDTNLDGKLRYVFGPSNAPEDGCGLWGSGATVTTSNGASGRIAAGNPFPSQSDAVIGTANDCTTGKIAANNPNFTPVD
jgi:hypothetical protein